MLDSADNKCYITCRTKGEAMIAEALEFRNNCTTFRGYRMRFSIEGEMTYDDA